MMSGSMITRNYADFRGVDFATDPGIVSLQRSPDALNIWKDYRSTQGTCIETRPGYKQIMDFKEKINSIFVYSKARCLVHAGNKLYLWDDFPSYDKDPILLRSDMNNIKSQMYMFGGDVYINDGLHYLKYNGTELKDVADNAYIPTTSIARKPTGGGTILEDINILSDKRKNTFVADGKSVDYYLDATFITSVDIVKVNGVIVKNYTVNTSQGKITFEVAPKAPAVLGQDTIEVTFTKIIPNYKNKIYNCTIAKVFDNRIFFSGNPDYPNVLFHCSLNAPNYISDLDYYQDGIKTPIKALVVGYNSLYVLKESNQNKDTIFIHEPRIDPNYGTIYPSKQGNVSVGCHIGATNYDDIIIFLSREGLESLTNSIDSKELVSHKSSLIDKKLVNAGNYENAVMELWQGYLFIAIDNEIFLADNRNMFENNKNLEYEWFYWKIKEDISVLKEYNQRLFFGTQNGKIFEFEGTNDNGEAINSYWTTPKDIFSYMQFLKTSNKRGAVAKIKNIPNGKVKIEVQTNKKDWKLLKEFSANGFDFNNIDFSNFSFATKDNSYVAFKIKIKKIIDFQLRFSSTEKDKPFGLYSCVLEAFIGSFVKRS